MKTIEITWFKTFHTSTRWETHRVILEIVWPLTCPLRVRAQWTSTTLDILRSRNWSLQGRLGSSIALSWHRSTYRYLVSSSFVATEMDFVWRSVGPSRRGKIKHVMKLWEYAIRQMLQTLQKRSDYTHMLIRTEHLWMKESQEFGMEYRQQWALDIWDLGTAWIGMSGVWAPEGSVSVVN
jgi:hypothetical protein